MELRRIEEASLNAWPALQQRLLDGWVLRFAGGYTKRANSINPLYEGSLEHAAKVALCEEIYARRSLPPIFRLSSFSPVSAELDALLAHRAYRRVDPTLVMVLALDREGRLSGRPVALEEADLDRWLALYGRFRGVELAEPAAHRAILETIAAPRLLALLSPGGRARACGLAVQEGELLGLFDLITDPKERRQGYGTELVRGLLAWGRWGGATRAYLQVEARNRPARELYQKLGFGPAYHYWYRVHPG